MVSSWISNIKSFCVFIESSAPAPNPAVWICKWKKHTDAHKKMWTHGMDVYVWLTAAAVWTEVNKRKMAVHLVVCFAASFAAVAAAAGWGHNVDGWVHHRPGCHGWNRAFFFKHFIASWKKSGWADMDLSICCFVSYEVYPEKAKTFLHRFLCGLVLQTRESAEAPPPMPLISISIQYQVKPEMIVICKNLMRQEKGTLAVSNYSYTR